MLIEKCRLSFPKLWTPEAPAPGQAPKFSAAFIFEKDSPQHKALVAEIKRVATEKWADKAPAIVKKLMATQKTCLRDGETKEDLDGFDDTVMFVSASNDKRPGVFDRDRTPLAQTDGKVYAGCYVNALVEVWAQDNQYGKRVNAQLRGVQFAADGEPFGGGGRPATEDDFPELDDPEEGADSDWDDAEGDDDWDV